MSNNNHNNTGLAMRTRTTDDIQARRRSRSRSNSPSNPSLPPLLRRRGGSGSSSGGCGPGGLLLGTLCGGGLITMGRNQQQDCDTWSDFSSMATMPRDKIVKRTLHPWSVHYSSSSRWMAKIALPETETSFVATAHGNNDTNNNNNNMNNTNNVKVRHVQYEFATEKDARKFCTAYTPPKLRNDGQCQVCHKHGSFRRCRTCGVNCCDTCATKWGKHMLPKTYLSSLHSHQHHQESNSTTGSFSSSTCGTNTSSVVRVCKACDWLSNAFCMSLLQGRYQDALQLYDTGNVNLRTSFADIQGEAMFPVHCAVLGGSLECVTWLIDKECCPITTITTTTLQNRSSSHTNNNNGRAAAAAASSSTLSVQTSSCRTLLDLAMTGRPKLDILAFLIRKGLSIANDVKDPTLVAKTLELIMKASTTATSSSGGGGPWLLSSLLPALRGDGMPVPIVEEEDMDGQLKEHDYDDAIEDATSSSNWDGNICHICFEQPMDCVLTPCGHQVCCTECATQLNLCPVCKVSCSYLRIFRS